MEHFSNRALRDGLSGLGLRPTLLVFLLSDYLSFVIALPLIFVLPNVHVHSQLTSKKKWYEQQIWTQRNREVLDYPLQWSDRLLFVGLDLLILLLDFLASLLYDGENYILYSVYMTAFELFYFPWMSFCWYLFYQKYYVHNIFTTNYK